MKLLQLFEAINNGECIYCLAVARALSKVYGAPVWGTFTRYDKDGYEDLAHAYVVHGNYMVDFSGAQPLEYPPQCELDGLWEPFTCVRRPITDADVDSLSEVENVDEPNAMRWVMNHKNMYDKIFAVSEAESAIHEDAAIRTYDPGVLEWLQEALSRPDADDLYLHGSRQVQDVFSAGEKRHKHSLLHFSKLTDPRFRDIPYQAEYYGPKLWLSKLNYSKPFDVRYPDKEPAQMQQELIPRDVQKYRLDHGDIYHIIEPALAKGYDMFVVWEVAAGTESYAVPGANQVQVIDTYDSREKV